KNQPILQTTGEDPGEDARGPFFSAGADGTSLIVVPNATVKGAKGHTVFLINHLEYQTEADNLDPQKPPVDLYAKLPMAMNLTVLIVRPTSPSTLPWVGCRSNSATSWPIGRPSISVMTATTLFGRCSWRTRRAISAPEPCIRQSGCRSMARNSARPRSNGSGSA